MLIKSKRPYPLSNIYKLKIQQKKSITKNIIHLIYLKSFIYMYVCIYIITFIYSIVAKQFLFFMAYQRLWEFLCL